MNSVERKRMKRRLSEQHARPGVLVVHGDYPRSKAWDELQIPREIFDLINAKIEHRPSPKDSNFRYIHHEDVIDIARLAFKKGRRITPVVDTPAPDSFVLAKTCPFDPKPIHKEQKILEHTIYQNIQDHNYYTYCNDCPDSACMVKVKPAAPVEKVSHNGTFYVPISEEDKG